MVAYDNILDGDEVTSPVRISGELSEALSTGDKVFVTIGAVRIEATVTDTAFVVTVPGEDLVDPSSNPVAISAHVEDAAGNKSAVLTAAYDTVNESTRIVADEDELRAAIGEDGVDLIILSDNFSLTSTLAIGRPVEIRGSAGSDWTLKTNSTGDNPGILVTSSGVTLKGFTVDADETDKYGIKVQPLGGSERIDGVTIEDLTIKNAGRTGIDFNAVANSTIKNVSANENGGNGITLTDVEDITLIDVSTSHNAWGGVAIYSQGLYFPPIKGSSGVVFENYVNDGHPIGIYAQEHIPSVKDIKFGSETTLYAVTATAVGKGDFTFFSTSWGDAVAYANERESSVVEERIVSQISPDADGFFQTGGGDALYRVIAGTTAADTLTGTDADETLLGFGGDDTFIPGDGADTIVGGAGANTLRSSSGGDVYKATVGESIIFELDNVKHSGFGDEEGVFVTKFDLSETGVGGAARIPLEILLGGTDFAGAWTAIQADASVMGFGIGRAIGHAAGHAADQFFLYKDGDEVAGGGSPVEGAHSLVVYERQSDEDHYMIYFDANGNEKLDDGDVQIEILGLNSADVSWGAIT